MTNTKYEAWMNGEALSGISPDLYISSIKATPPKATVTASEMAKRNGEHIDSIRWKGTSVSISFILRKSTGKIRQEIVQKVCAWAAKGVLEISDRPGQQLRVVCINPPYVDDSCSWTTPITITLQTADFPFWESKTPASLTLSGSSGSGNLYVPGNAGEAYLEATITPGNSMANITITSGSTSITLTGVGATSANPLVIAYDGNGFLTIKVGTTSVLNKRTGADDLVVECGKINAISYTASASVTAVFRARGLWM